MSEPMEELVTIKDKESHCLLGLLMWQVLSANSADPHKRAVLSKLRGDIRVQAAEMVITLRFEEQGATVLHGEQSTSPRAWVRGSMKALLGVADGGAMVGPVLAGKIRFGGNPFVLLKVLPLIQAPNPESASE